MQDKKDKGSSRNLPSQSSQPSQRSQPSQPPKREVANLPDLIEIINTDQGLRFFTSNCELKDSVLMDGVICIPIRKNLFPVPDEKMMEYLGEDDSDLFDAVESFIREHVDCPHERHPEILTAFTFHTYLPEKAETSPIIWFHGPKGSGKSRGGEVLSQLCRRGLSTASLTGPGLFRVNELCTPTFVIDEIQIYGEKGDKNLKDMLNVRYKKGKQIIRINIDKKGSESVETFNAFGPTVLWGTEELPDTVRSRTIALFMEPNVRKVRRHVDKERARELRNRLVAFRCRHYDTVLENPDPLVQNGRLDEVLLPLHQMVRLARPWFESEFTAFAESLEVD